MTKQRANGVGGWISYVEALVHEENMKFEEAMCFPISTGLVLLQAARERMGQNDGLSFVDHAIDRAKAEMRRYLEANFKII